MQNPDTKTMEIWNTSKYYNQARKGSLDKKHFGMELLKDLSLDANNILDLGCGEGTRLNFAALEKKGVGVDISEKAVNTARKTYPALTFKIMNLESLSFKNSEFDLVYSAYVLEHLQNPEKVIDEAIRVLKPNGKLLLIAPNYGAPNRASPVFKGSRFKKLIKGLNSDLILRKEKYLEWNKVEPQKEVSNYHSDTDTTIEPYLRTLVRYLESKKMKILKYSSCWEEELNGAKIHQKLFKLLSKIELYPFMFWGPHLVVAAKKD